MHSFISFTGNYPYVALPGMKFVHHSSIQVAEVPTELFFFIMLEAHTLSINVLCTLNLENVHYAFAKIIYDLLIEVFLYAN